MIRIAMIGSVVLAALPAIAGDPPTFPGPVSVPEIDALSGLGAIAAIGAIATLVWVRRRH